jgi:hypothetical protein
MGKLFAFALGFWFGEHRGEVPALRQGEGGPGWMTGLLIFVGVLAFGHVKLGAPHAPQSRIGEPSEASSTPCPIWPGPLRPLSADAVPHNSHS